MTAKEYLRQYERAVNRARRYREEYERESELIDAVRSLSDNDGMPHGYNIGRPTEEKAIRLADRKLRLIDAELEAIRIKQEVFDFISGIDDAEGKVLFERYINLRKWEEICVIMNYSWNGIHKVHRRALALVDEKLNRV